MEPITTSAVVTLVTALAKKAFDKAFETTVDETTKSGFQWLKSLFWKDDKPVTALQQLIEKPESQARYQAVESIIAIDLEDNPSHVQLLHKVVDALEYVGNTSINQENVVTGTISAGGHVIVGNNNQV